MGSSLTAVGPDTFTMSMRDSGPFLVRIHFTPYWTVTAGDACVQRDGDWTEVDVNQPGAIEVAAHFSLAGLFRRDRECSG